MDTATQKKKKLVTHLKTANLITHYGIHLYNFRVQLLVP